MRRDIVKSSAKLVLPHGGIPAPHEPFAHAETAVDRAAIGNQQDYPVRIAVNKAPDRTQGILTQWIRALRRIFQFTDIRHALLPDGIVGVSYQTGIIIGQPNGIPC